VRPDRFATVLLDTGAVLALARRDRRVQTYLAQAQRYGADVRASLLTLAELRLDGGDAAAVAWALSQVRWVNITEADCRGAARLMSESGTRGSTVDAVIASAALRLRAPVILLTSDSGDMGRLLGRRKDVAVIGV
jgi:predicted nucleic acid-binding protein